MTKRQDDDIVEIEVKIGAVLARIEATKALYSLLLEIKRDAVPSMHGYSKGEAEELQELHRRHLLRRAREEARKAGVDL